MSIIAFIPARAGSKRVINKKPVTKKHDKKKHSKKIVCNLFISLTSFL